MFSSNFTVGNQHKTSTPVTPANLIEIFCTLDEFYKFLASELKQRTVSIFSKCSQTVRATSLTAR